MSASASLPTGPGQQILFQGTSLHSLLPHAWPVGAVWP